MPASPRRLACPACSIDLKYLNTMRYTRWQSERSSRAMRSPTVFACQYTIVKSTGRFGHDYSTRQTIVTRERCNLQSWQVHIQRLMEIVLSWAARGERTAPSRQALAANCIHSVEHDISSLKALTHVRALKTAHLDNNSSFP